MSFKHAMGTTLPTSTSVTEEAPEVSINSGETTAVYSCPQDGCVRVFQRLRFGEALVSGKVYTVTRETFANGFSENGIQDLLGDKSPRGVSDTKGGMGYQGS